MGGKKIIVFSLILAMIFSLCACGVSNNSDKAISHNDYSSDSGSSPLTPPETITEYEVTEGSYSLCNRGADKFLTYSDSTLFLGDSPAVFNFQPYNSSSYYIYAQGTDIMLDIDNAYIADGTTIKLWPLTGYPVQMWKAVKNSNGSFSIVSNANESYCLGFYGNTAVLQLRDTSNLFQEWTLTRITDENSLGYKKYESSGNIIELQLPLNIEDTISAQRIQKWANDLETAYYTFADFTSFTPYSKIIVRAYLPCKYLAYVIDDSNVIHIDSTFIYEDLAKMSLRSVDWNFCALHEMGHMFDSKRSWLFEAEVLTDLKVAYVLEKHNVSAVPSEFDASINFFGKDIINAYHTLGGDFSTDYNIYGFAARFLEIKNDIGWEPFKSTFHYMQSNHLSYINLSRTQKFEKFISLLSEYSGKDVKSYFSQSEWNTIISKTYS